MEDFIDEIEEYNNLQRVILYWDKEGYLEIAICCNYRECLAWGGMAVCDFCNEHDSNIYLCPELGHKGLCTKCFKEHKKRVQWYVEDTNVVFNNLILFVQKYGLYFTDRDLDKINEFFSNHRHPEINIRKFLNK